MPLTVPATWTYLHTRPIVTGNYRRGRSYNVAYYVPATTTVEEVEAVAPYGLRYPGATGSFAPFMQDYRMSAGVQAGKMLVELYFLPPNLHQLLRSQPDKGVLSWDFSTKVFTVPSEFDLDKKRLHGEESVTVGGAKYNLMYEDADTGNGAWPNYRVNGVLFRLDVYQLQTDISLLMDLSGCIGSGQTFLGQPAGNFLYTPGRGRKDLGVSAGLFATHYFFWSRVAWNDLVKTNVFKVTFIPNPVKNDAGTVVGTQTVPWREKTTSSPESRRLFEAKDWAALAKMIDW